jgi:superfamily I DNA and/or RNA helicase
VFERKRGTTEADYEWLGRDVFDKSGISQGDAESRRIFFADSRLAAITSQRRCTRGIWTHVQHLYPEIESDVDEVGRAEVLALPPLPGKAAVLLDVARNAEREVCRKMQRSWENPTTAEIALTLAYTLVTSSVTSPSVAIIAPYRAQVKNLRRALRQQQRSEDRRYWSIDAGTVHQFQGSEADVVIFDLVDGPGRSGLGLLLRGDTGLRLVNVAVSRARGKLILIADRTWFRRAVQPGDNLLLWDLIMHSPAGQLPSRTADVPQITEDGNGKHQ